MKKIIFSFLSIILCLYGFAIEPPTLQCIEQLVGNGRLRITWSWNNLNNVASDDVYTFFMNGGQNSRTVSPYNNGYYVTSTEIELPASLISDHYTCYIQAQNTSTGESCISNSLSTIRLTVTPYNLQGDSTAAYLEWDAVSSSTTGGSWDGDYLIYKKKKEQSRACCCPVCGDVMQKDGKFGLPENHLAEDRVEALKFTPYRCVRGHSVVVKEHGRLYSQFITCPKCGAYTMKLTNTETLKEATYSSSGEKRETYTCQHCGHTVLKSVVIPKKVRYTSSGSSSGSSSVRSYSSHSSSHSSGGSFGGGHSGGGGYSGRW